MSDAEITEETEVRSKRKRLNRSIEGNVLTFEVIETGDSIEFDLEECSPEIVDKLTIHGAWQKLGDSAAGKSGSDITEAITKVRDGLYAGDFNVKSEPGSRISKKQISDGLSNMSEAEAENARKVLESMGITL